MADVSRQVTPMRRDPVLRFVNISGALLLASALALLLWAIVRWGRRWRRIELDRCMSASARGQQGLLPSHHRFSGCNPVCLAMRASMRGPSSSPS